MTSNTSKQIDEVLTILNFDSPTEQDHEYLRQAYKGATVSDSKVKVGSATFIDGEWISATNKMPIKAMAFDRKLVLYSDESLLLKIGNRGKNITFATMFFPCVNVARLIVGHGSVKRIVFGDPIGVRDVTEFGAKDTALLFKEAGIRTVYIDGSEFQKEYGVGY